MNPQLTYQFKKSQNWVKKPPKCTVFFHITTSLLAIVAMQFGIMVSHVYMARLFGIVRFVVQIQTFKKLYEPISGRDNLPLV